MLEPDTRFEVEPSAEFVNVGKNFCIYRPDNHALALINESAKDIFKSALGEKDMSDLAARICRRESRPLKQVSADIEAVLSRLRSDGFLDQDERTSHRARYSHKFPGCVNPVLREIYHMAGGQYVRLICDDDRLAKLLKSALHPMTVEFGKNHTSEIAISKKDATYSIWRDRITIAQGLDLAAARRVALQVMLMAILPPERVAAVLHASSLCIDNRSIILAGSTGSGKTTLMMALVGSGAQYLADDLTPLDRSGRFVSGFTVAASIKSGSWEVLGSEFPDLAFCEIHNMGDRSVRYFNPVRTEHVGIVTKKTAALIFPKFVSGSHVRMSRLAPEEALARLFQSGSEVVGANPSIKPLATLVNDTPAWQIEFSNINCARTAVLAAVSCE